MIYKIRGIISHSSFMLKTTQLEYFNSYIMSGVYSAFSSDYIILSRELTSTKSLDNELCNICERGI